MLVIGADSVWGSKMPRLLRSEARSQVAARWARSHPLLVVWVVVATFVTVLGSLTSVREEDVRYLSVAAIAWVGLGINLLASRLPWMRDR